LKVSWYAVESFLNTCAEALANVPSYEICSLNQLYVRHHSPYPNVKWGGQPSAQIWKLLKINFSNIWKVINSSKIIENPHLNIVFNTFYHSPNIQTQAL
jgi:hypothetical protein